MAPVRQSPVGQALSLRPAPQAGPARPARSDHLGEHRIVVHELLRTASALVPAHAWARLRRGQVKNVRRKASQCCPAGGSR
jgi:hypothetical protein